MYQNQLNEVKLKKNCKITTYLYQIILIDHKKHLGAMEKTYILGSTPNLLKQNLVGWGYR